MSSGFKGVRIMKSVFMLLILTSFLVCSMGFAQSPLVRKDVHVLKNATDDQCQAAANGRAGPQDMVGYSGAGEFTGTTGPGVRSCTNCAVDYRTQDCVCKLCYYYFN